MNYDSNVLFACLNRIANNWLFLLSRNRYLFNYCIFIVKRLFLTVVYIYW